MVCGLTLWGGKTTGAHLDQPSFERPWGLMVWNSGFEVISHHVDIGRSRCPPNSVHLLALLGELNEILHVKSWPIIHAE